MRKAACCLLQTQQLKGSLLCTSGQGSIHICFRRKLQGKRQSPARPYATQAQAHNHVPGHSTVFVFEMRSRTAKAQG